MLLLLTDGVTDLITDKKLKKIIKKEESKDILKRIIHEALYVDQHLFIPFRLKKKYLSSYIKYTIYF
jgi:serine/threonine protein phosphatase PrpC